MGVYIKGMEMPKKPIAIIICPDGKVFRVSYPEQIAEAVPVPEHGRLIDADALLRGCERIEGKYVTREYAFSQSAIENAPTILEAEEGE